MLNSAHRSGSVTFAEGPLRGQQDSGRFDTNVRRVMARLPHPTPPFRGALSPPWMPRDDLQTVHYGTGERFDSRAPIGAMPLRAVFTISATAMSGSVLTSSAATGLGLLGPGGDADRVRPRRVDNDSVSTRPRCMISARSGGIRRPPQVGRASSLRRTANIEPPARQHSTPRFRRGAPRYQRTANPVAMRGNPTAISRWRVRAGGWRAAGPPGAGR